MSPATNAASSSSSSSSVYFSTTGPYTGKGKQLADPPFGQRMADENVPFIVDNGSYVLIDPSPPTYFNRIGLGSTGNPRPDEILNTCERTISKTNKRYAKIADREGKLEKFKEICKTERKTIADLEVKAPIDTVTHIGLETAKEAHSVFLQERINEALRIVDSVCLIIETLIAHPKESMSSLDKSVESIASEIAKLQKSLPTPAKAFLGVLFVAGLVAPFMGLVWYILGTLGLFSMTAILPQAIGGAAWVVGVICGIILKWPDYKNACAERASVGTRQLIQCYGTITLAHKDFKKKMDSVRLDKIDNKLDDAFRASSINFAATTAVNEKLDQLLATRSTSASPDADLIAENARLREELEKTKLQKEQYRTVILLNNIDISKLG